MLSKPKDDCKVSHEKKWGARLVCALDTRNRKQAWLADAVGVSRPTVHSWCSGNIKMMAADHLLATCAALKIRPEWLVLGSGEMDAPLVERRADERRDGDRRGNVVAQK